MNGVFFAELAVLFKFDSFGIVLLVFHVVVIALFAFGASKRNLISGGVSHSCRLLKKSTLKYTPKGALIYFTINGK